MLASFFVIFVLLSIKLGQSKNLKQMSLLRGIHQTIHSYDAFLIDQWGVLHDGKNVYNGVLDCLQELKNSNKRLILISNSSKRKSSSRKNLQKVGIDPNYFDDIVTSGELAWQEMSNRNKLSTSLQKVCLIGNGDDDIDYIESAQSILSTPEDADFLLARGTFCIVDGNKPENMNKFKASTSEELINAVDNVLQRCAARKIPLLVTNPDFYRPDQSQSPMPGWIGLRYEELVKEKSLVKYIGKPHKAVYDECIKILSSSGDGNDSGSSSSDSSSEKIAVVDKIRICGVGDSLEHDVLGAHNFAISSIFIVNGVHAAEAGARGGGGEWNDEDNSAKESLKELLSKHPLSPPTYSIASFRW